MEKKQRSMSLDVLRGIAVLGMVYASNISFGVLPGWMYHAQEPPPSHVFVPGIAGITWVDVVFPVFLFCMGAAFPLSLHKMESIKEPQKRFLTVAVHLVKRFFVLLFFSYVAFYGQPVNMKQPPEFKEYIVSLLVFALLHFLLVAPHGNRKDGYKWAVFVTLLLWLSFYSFPGGFLVGKNDVILFILAFTSLLGSLVWWLTRFSTKTQVCFLLVLFCMFLSIGSGRGDLYGIWPRWLMDPLFYVGYLKYLFIVLPASWAGMWLRHKAVAPLPDDMFSQRGLQIVLVLSFLLVLSNIILLYKRAVWMDLWVTALLGMAGFVILGRTSFYRRYRTLFNYGVFFCLCGILLDPFEKGIRKDPVTYSYLFECTGLSFLLLFVLVVAEVLFKKMTKVFFLIGSIGKNPMVAYVSGGMLVTPVFGLLGLDGMLDRMSAGMAGGFVRGTVLTAAIGLVTLLFTKKGWFWKS